MADCLVEADLQGVPTHGVARLPFYCSRLRRGLIEPRPALTVVAETSSAALLDAGNGLGPVGGRRALSIAGEKARSSGVGACGVRRSNHLGMLGWYVEAAAREGMVALAFSNAPATMAAPGGRTRLLGTNPLAAGLPAGARGPVVVDMATSQVARARITAASARGEPIPSGWAFDLEGRPTTSAAAALAGTVAPLGGAKGFGLALLVEALAGVLTGAGVGPEVTGTVSDSDRASDVGHLFLVFDPSALGVDFEARMAGLVELVRGSRSADGGEGPRLPGERRRAERERRLECGLELDVGLVMELRQLGARRSSSPGAGPASS